MSIQRWKLTIEYTGSSYAGWQRQKNAVSIQQEVEEAITKFCQQEITIHCAGRTDAGVHAKGQVCHLDLDYGGRDLSGYEFAKAINAHLRPAPIAVVKAEKTHKDFHARFDAINKLYTYRMIRRDSRPVFDDGLAWWRGRVLDIEAMREGAQHLLGKHDFTSFRDSACQAKHPVRTIDRLDIEVLPYDEFHGLEIRFHVEARSFLHHMVRTIVGTLAKVGDGSWAPDDVKAALEACDRTKAGPNAPPDGLYLMRVDY